MSNHLYLVSNGRAERLAPGHTNPLFQRDSVWETDLASVFALAGDHAEALALARAYDRGEIWPADVKLPGGHTVFALEPTPRDDETADGWRVTLAVCIASAVAGLILAAVAFAAVMCAAR